MKLIKLSPAAALHQFDDPQRTPFETPIGRSPHPIAHQVRPTRGEKLANYFAETAQAVEMAGFSSSHRRSRSRHMLRPLEA
jgi:hypothetical protein